MRLLSRRLLYGDIVAVGPNKMTKHSANLHKEGTTELTFTTSLGTPIEDLQYRLTDDRGNVWSGSTGKGGKGVTIVRAQPNEDPTSTSVWGIAGEDSIRLEIRRDDGSWKTIGSFQHAVGAHKQINVISGTIAMPFQMAPA